MKKIILLSFIFLSTFGYGQEIWHEAISKSNDEVVFIKSHMPSVYHLYTVDIAEISILLQEAPLRENGALKNTTTILEVPNRQGNLQSFKILEAPIMASELAAQFPMIKTYVGQGVDDPTATLRMSIGTDGLHIMIRAADQPTLFVDPYTKNRDKYIVYSKGDLPVLHEFNCEFVDEAPIRTPPNVIANQKNITDGKMRQYNLAIATTIEYSAFHLTNQGVPAGASLAQKKAAVLSAITTTINRVTGIYETELGATFVLNANETDIIFIDSDNFSNNDASLLIDESQTEIDNIIGNSNYDIGHTFSTGGGGLASLGGRCTITRKAKAITGSSQPIGDAYDVDYVAHEMGHHFGANHSYNGDGVGSCTTSNSSTAAEPGSGSTIMAYAGICGSLNVQQNSDAYFHIVNLKEINDRFTNQGNYTNTGFYLQCSSDTNTGNQEPIANAGADYTIPKGTAFVLHGAGNDPDGDAMTYCWDEIDVQQPNIYPLVSTTTTGPLYRSFLPTVSPDRYFPKFETVFGGSLATTWEVTPTVGRDLNFSLTVRDNRADGGQNTSDDMLVTVSGVAGPFEVTSQSTEEVWTTGEVKMIAWNVAGTTANGVNAANVEIALVDNTGAVLSILNANTPNDGSEAITVPNVVNDNTRVRVAGKNHIFYALNSAVVAVNSTPAYCSTECTSSGSTQYQDGVTKVILNTINNTSVGDPAYSDYKSISTDVAREQTYNLTVHVNSDGNYTELSKVWIDWNRNCDFSDSGEEYDLGSASFTPDTGAVTSNSPLLITVPVTAALGKTRMRVSAAYDNGSSVPTACGSGFLGEVEDYTLNITATSLAVALMNFRASVIDEKFIQLDWQTASEVNNAGFELQRSTDGKKYEVITWIDGMGNTVNRQSYFYMDKKVQNNQTYYYRLKQIDFDGAFEYSKIQSAVINNERNSISVFPNPAVDQIQLRFGDLSNNFNSVNFELFDALGKKVISQLVQEKRSAIDVGYLPSGVYFYKIRSDQQILKSGRILIQ